MLFLLPLTLAAKTVVPAWTDEAERQQLYPANDYYCAYAEYKSAAKQTKEDALAAATDSARVLLTLQLQQHIGRLLPDETTDSCRLTAADLPYTETLTFYHPHRHTAYVLVVLNKAESTDFVLHRLQRLIDRTAAMLGKAEIYAVSHEKLRARSELGKAESLLCKATVQECLLMILPDNSSDIRNDLRAVRQRADSLQEALRHGLNIRLICNALLFGNTYGSLQNELKAALSPLGCNFMPSARDTDYEIIVTAIAREQNRAEIGQIVTYFSTIEAKVIITHPASGRRLYEDSFTEKGAHSIGFEAGGRDAYSRLSQRISQIIIDRLTKESL